MQLCAITTLRLACTVQTNWHTQPAVIAPPQRAVFSTNVVGPSKVIEVSSARTAPVHKRTVIVFIAKNLQLHDGSSSRGCAHTHVAYVGHSPVISTGRRVPKERQKDLAYKSFEQMRWVPVDTQQNVPTIFSEYSLTGCIKGFVCFKDNHITPNLMKTAHFILHKP